MHRLPHNRRHDCAAIALLGVLALAFWGNCLWGGKVPVAAIYQRQMLPWSAVAEASSEARQWDSLLWDSMAQFYPWRLLLHRAAQNDQLPLWNPFQFCGTPFVGNGQSAMFYPLNWLYFVVHPTVGLGLSAALHFLLGGVFVFGLARAWKLSVLPALFAALAFSYGGFMVTWIELPTLPNSLIWLPLAWWGIELIAREPLEGPATSRPAVRGALMLALALGMTLLAGHFQIAAYVWVFAFLYALIRPIAVARAASPARARMARQCALGFALALLLAMAQILPTLELAGYSSRGSGGPSAAGLEFHRQRALQPIELATLLTPDFLGSPVTNDYPGISYSEHCGFVGAITLLLGLVGMILRPRTGDESRVGARVPTRTMSWLFGGIALFTLWGAMAGPPAMLLYWGVPKLGQAGGFARLLSVWTVAAAMWGAVGLQAVVDSLTRAPSAANGGPDDIRPLRPFAARAVIPMLSIVLLLAQVLPWAYRFNPRAKAEDVYPETELIRQLRARVGSDRYVAVNDRKAWGLAKVPTNVILPPNAATVYGLRCVDGYDSLFPSSYRQFAAGLEGTDPSPPANGNMLLLQDGWDWQAAAGATFVQMSPESRYPLPRPLWQGEGAFLLQNDPRGRLPRAYLWSRFAAFSSMLPPASYAPLPLTTDDLSHVRLEVASAWSRVRLVERDQPQVILRDTVYPGWRAVVDGVARPIETIHMKTGASQPYPVFRQVSLERGAKTVDFVYFPASVACGLFVSLVALMVIAGLAVWRRGGGACG